jgi:acetyl esterase
MNIRESIRRAAGRTIIDGGFRVLSRFGRFKAELRGELRGLEVIRDLPYLDTGQREHRLDVYRPTERTGPLPVVLYVHGGGFRILSKESHWVMAKSFAEQGSLVFNMSYRLAPENPFPAGFEDVCAAWLWVIKNAARLGGDPSRIVVAGESAGANLISSLVLATCYERPEPCARGVFKAGVVPVAAIPFCGILQVSDIVRFQRRRGDLPVWIVDRLVEVSAGYLGAESAEPGAHPLADPLLIYEDDTPVARALPPFFMSVGTRDPILDDTRRMHAALDARGVPVESLYCPGELHAFQAFTWRPESKRSWDATFRFLANVLDSPTDLELAG